MFVSESKTATQQIAETISKSLATIELSPELQKEMDAYYLMRMPRKQFEVIATFLAQNVTRLTMAYDLIGYMLVNAAVFEDMLDASPDEVVSRLQTRLDMNYTQMTALEGKLSKEIKAKLVESLSAVSSAIIRPSKRFSGGMDIVHTGTPCPSSAIAGAGNFAFYQAAPAQRLMLSEGEDYENEKISKYSSELSIGALRAADQIQQALFGNLRSGSNVFDPDVTLVPLDFNWSSLNMILQSIHPIFNRLDVRLFTDLDKKAVEVLGAFMSLGLKRLPDPNMISKMMAHLRYQPDAPTAQLFNPAVLSVNIQFEGAIVTSIRKELVNYIVQGSDHKTMALYRWYQAWGSVNLRVSGQAKGSIRKITSVPRYVTSATKIPDLVKLREEFHYNVSDIDADDNGLTLMPNGTPAVLPNRGDIDLEAVKEYESELERVQSDLYSRNIPLSVGHETLRTDFFKCMTGSLEFDQEIQKEAQSLSRFANTCVGTDPNFNIVVCTDSSGLAVQGMRTIGAKRPQPLDLADSLGYDFAQPGEAPNFRTATQFFDAMEESTVSTAAYREARQVMFRAGQLEKGDSKFVSACDGKQIAFAQGEPAHTLYKLMSELAAAYGFLAGAGRVPKPEALVKEAMEALGYDGPEAITKSEYDNGLYTGLIENDGTATVLEEDNALWLLRIITRVLNDAAGLRGSNLMSSAIREYGTLDAARESLENSTHFFSLLGRSKLADMARLSNYLGGSILNILCGAIASVDKKVLYADISRDPAAPPARRIQQHILPLAVMINKVLPNSLEIFEAAETEQERTRPNDSLTADEVKIPGLAAGVAFLPHQLKAHQSLRQRPRYAVLFIAPGGGKTILGLTDIGALTQELQDLGEKPIRPLIICPTNLVSTWADDCRKFMPAWNVVPITADTVNTWGEDRMYDVLNTAPRNTIFVAGLSFLSTGTFNVDIGGVRVQIRGAVEFINRFNFSYVLLDESHKVKNFQGGQIGSQTHFNSKLIFTAPSIRYARLATGTLVTDRVTDVVGQAALLSPAIFGDDLNIVDQDDGTLAMIRRTHSRMSNHTAFISMKRKEWAFMLPNPVDTFIQVQIDDPTVPHSDLHMQTYEAMYRQVLEMLDEAAKSAKAKSEDDDGDSSDDGDSEFNEDEMDDGDVLGRILASNADLNMYFQRMEMLLTDPMGDDIARLTFEAAGVKEFTSAKVVSVIERIKKHFEVQSERNDEEKEHQIFMWKPGVTPRELDIAVYDGKKYLARKQSTDFRRQYLPPSMLPPPQDPDYWKEERSGKLIVFTRYVRSANAVYNALPDEYKRVALVFHGEVGKLGQNKEANLDAFKTDDRYQIIIANEQAISEGHNMQMGSRIIRVDTPWSPGTYDQSTARIFRPDVAAADIDDTGKPGDMPREVVFIDWIMTSGTLEVGKVARLMWKTVEKIQFDEKGNPLYEPLNDYDLKKISMNASLLIEKNTIEDFSEYFMAKRDLNDIESREFSEMRKTTAARMVPLEPAPALSDFKVLNEVPIVANQKIPDRNGWGLERLLDWTKEKSFADGETLKSALHRMPVVTEFGNGIIVSVTTRNVDGKLREDSPVSTARVRLAGTEQLISIPATKIHVATKVSKADLDAFFKVRKAWATETERKKVTAAAERVEAAERAQDDAQTGNTVSTVEKTVPVVREKARVEKRKANVVAKKPINEGVEAAARAAGVRQVAKLEQVSGRVRRVRNLSLDDLEEVPEDVGMKVKMKPMVYNGFIALEARVENPDVKALKELEFIHFGRYAYVDFLYYADFEKFLDFVEETKKMEFDGPTAKRLQFIMDGFDNSGKMTFNSKQALKVDTDLKQFFLVRHRTAKDRKHIKAYPMVLPDRLRIMIDLDTNPRAQSWVGVKIAGTRKWGKFEESEGMWITFTKNITGAKARMNRMLKAGFPISNVKATTEALSKIKGTKRSAK